MSANAVLPVLVAGMLLSGVFSTLLMKYQDMTCVADCDTPHPKMFEQPVMQTLTMFVGEAGCWLLVLGSYLVSRWRAHREATRAKAYQPVSIDDVQGGVTSAGEEADEYADEDDEEVSAGMTSSQTLVDATNVLAKPLIDGEELGLADRKVLSGFKIALLALPAICDILGTTLMNVGLLFVAASIFQMTRGALVLFVGLFSVLFLKRHLTGWKWASLFIVMLGVAIVGLAGVIEGKNHDSTHLPGNPNPDEGHDVMPRLVRTVSDDFTTQAAHTAAETVLGIFLIAAAQVFSAGQFVLEESIMERYSMDPIQVVGWEGTFGFLITLSAQGILHAAIGRTEAGQGGYFDARAAFGQTFTIPALFWTTIGSMFAIAGVNTFGLSVTRTLSATSRSTIDTCRTLLIWLVSLGLGWESFKWLQVLGFAILVWGTGIFNDIIRPPTVAWLQRRSRRGPIALEEDDDAPRPNA